MYIPEKGDLVYLDFDPSAGKEIMKRRPALVISRKIFNEHTGFALVAPVTSTVRNMKMEVILPETSKIQGSVLIHQMKSLDYEHRCVERVDSVDKGVISEVINMAKVISS